MKTIFKKNQIILTALAIMIAVVGYLNFARDKENEADKEAALSTAGASLDADELEDEMYQDLSAEDIGEDEYFQYQISETGDLILSENQLSAKKDGENKQENTQQENGENKGTATDAENTQDERPEGTPQADISETGQGDSQETDADSAPGEAVLASVSLQPGYFANARLSREQMRAKNKEALQSIISDSTVADELKQGAIDEIIALTARAEMENAAEILLEAKGYEGVVVSMTESEVDVVVNAESITDQQIAQIEDIVSRKTGIASAGIVIATVIVEE